MVSNGCQGELPCEPNNVFRSDDAVCLRCFSNWIKIYTHVQQSITLVNSWLHFENVDIVLSTLSSKFNDVCSTSTTYICRCNIGGYRLAKAGQTAMRELF